VIDMLPDWFIVDVIVFHDVIPDRYFFAVKS
jgi:hypothetical protein